MVESQYIYSSFQKDNIVFLLQLTATVTYVLYRLKVLNAKHVTSS